MIPFTSTTRATGEPTGAAAPAGPPPGDQLLDTIFTEDQDGGERPLPDPQAVGTANSQIVVATDGLHVPAVSAQQEQELSGNGGPELRPASVAYQALLARRPHLGAAKGLTPERYQQIIDKDRAYDTLSTTTTAVQQATTGARDRAEALVTSDVVTVATYVAPRTDPANFTDNENITTHFAPVQSQLLRTQEKARKREQRHISAQNAIGSTISGHIEQQTALPNLGRLAGAADDKVDLLDDPVDTTPTGAHAGPPKPSGTPAQKKKPKPRPGRKPGQPKTKPGAGKTPKPLPKAKP